jgi:hypothetical protein
MWPLTVSEIPVVVSLLAWLAPLVCLANYNLGKSFALIGYLLFYLNTLRKCVILQIPTSPSPRLGLIFDNLSIRELSIYNYYDSYRNGKLYYLFVGVDGREEYLYPKLNLYSNIIVVTSLNL